MLACFGTFLSPLYGIKLFINLMMAAAAACEMLAESSYMSLDTLFRQKLIFIKNYFIILILRHNGCPFNKKHSCVLGFNQKAEGGCSAGGQHFNTSGAFRLPKWTHRGIKTIIVLEK